MPIQLALLFDGEYFFGCVEGLYINSNIFEMFGDRFIGALNDGYVALELNFTE